MILDTLTNPASIAVFGASEDEAKFGGRILKYLTLHGFPGEILPINPARDVVQGIKAYPRASAAPVVAEVAIVAAPPARLEDIVNDCAAAGVSACICVTSHFADKAAESRALERAKSTGMRIVGPNCLGVISPPNQMAMISSYAVERPALPQGGVSLVSQSGALMTSVFDKAADRGVGFRHLISVGNQIDVEISEILEALVSDPGTTAVCLYMEGVTAPAGFRRAGRKAHLAGKPVFVVKAGRSEAGAAAAASHTASLLGSFEAFSAACAHAGIVMCEDTDQMIGAADLFSRQPPPRAPGLAVISGSGGAGALTLDRIAASEMSNDPGIVPLDLGALPEGWNTDAVETAARSYLSSDHVGAGLFVLTPQPLMAESVRCIATAARKTHTPCLVAMAAGRAADTARQAAMSVGLPFVEDLTTAVLAIQAWRAAHAIHSDCTPAGALPTPAPLKHPSLKLSEVEAKELVSAYGITVTRQIVTRSREQVAESVPEIRHPLVMKAIARSVVHKSDAGGVVLNVRTVEDALDGFDRISSAMVAVADFEGVVLQTQAQGVFELFLGCRWDPNFGPLLTIGAGGRLVEHWKDIQTLCLPVDGDLIERHLHLLKCWPLIAGYRGDPGADVPAIVSIALSLARLAERAGPNLHELDLNPVIVGASGTAEATAVDARATVSTDWYRAKDLWR